MTYTTTYDYILHFMMNEPLSNAQNAYLSEMFISPTFLLFLTLFIFVYSTMYHLLKALNTFIWQSPVINEKRVNIVVEQKLLKCVHNLCKYLCIHKSKYIIHAYILFKHVYNMKILLLLYVAYCIYIFFFQRNPSVKFVTI